MLRNPFSLRSAGNVAAWIGLVVLSMAAAVFAYIWSERKGYAYLDDLTTHQLDLYVAGMESELGKYEYLPSLMELDPEVVSLLSGGGKAGLAGNVNRRLTMLNVRAGSLAIFVTDLSGVVRAASNWYQPGSLVGEDFSALPYFSDALKEGRGRFFATDPMFSSPEYYFAEPVRRGGDVIGVAVVKISLAPLVSTWSASIANAQSEKFFVIDRSGTIIMSSIQDWRYKPTTLLASMQRVRHQGSGARAKEEIAPFGMVIERPLERGIYLVRLPGAEAGQPGKRYVVQDRQVVRPGWRFVTLSEASDVQLNARYAALGAGTVVAFFGLLGLYLAQRRRAIQSRLAAQEALQRAHDQLEVKVTERTAELHHANADLLREVVERKRTEQVLRETQDDLIQASKLALLGQMAAGISHEINQPLTALRSLSHNTRLLLERGRTDRIGRNLLSIAELTERMGRITGELKSFARKAPLTIAPVILTRAVDNALLLMENRIRSEHVDVHLDIPATLQVLCDVNRLEQVLLNLIANALDAMAESETRRLAIQALIEGERAIVRVTDSGSGIPAAALPRLFEPFFSTKPPGKGLGLGLAISAGIVREFGGTLRAANTEDGASLEFDLKTAKEEGNV